MKAATAHSSRIDYRGLWSRDLRAGRDGQQLDRPSTWKLDGLWSAVCYQLRAEEIEAHLAFALDHGTIMGHAADTGLDRDVGLSALLRAAENEWEEAHRAYLSGLPKHLRDRAKPIRRVRVAHG